MRPRALRCLSADTLSKEVKRAKISAATVRRKRMNLTLRAKMMTRTSSLRVRPLPPRKRRKLAIATTMMRMRKFSRKTWVMTQMMMTQKKKPPSRCLSRRSRPRRPLLPRSLRTLTQMTMMRRLTCLSILTQMVKKSTLRRS